MRTIATAWAATALVMLGLDALWLGFATSRLYRPLLGEMLREDFSLPAAAIFYALYTIGVVFFAVLPSVAQEDWRNALVRGAFLGLFGYGVYDLTNQATLRGWPLALTIADLAWGVVLTAVAATAGHLAARMLGGSG